MPQKPVLRCGLCNVHFEHVSQWERHKRSRCHRRLLKRLNLLVRAINRTQEKSHASDQDHASD